MTDNGTANGLPASRAAATSVVFGEFGIAAPGITCPRGLTTVAAGVPGEETLREVPGSAGVAEGEGCAGSSGSVAGISGTEGTDGTETGGRPGTLGVSGEGTVTGTTATGAETTGIDTVGTVDAVEAPADEAETTTRYPANPLSSSTDLRRLVIPQHRRM
jgi:hypothetical protein